MNKNKTKQDNKLWPFKGLVLSPSGGGKSYLTFKEILWKFVDDGYVDIFHIIIFSKTVKSDPPQLEWIEKCEKIYKRRYPQKHIKKNGRSILLNKDNTYQKNNTSEQINLDWLYDLYNFQKSLADQQKPFNNWLICLDDQFSEQLISHPTPFIKDLFMIGRHYGIQLLLLLQSYQSALNPVCRRQLTDFWIGRLNNQYDIDTILEQFSGQMIGIKTKEAINILNAMYVIANQYINKGYGFLHVMCERITGQGKFEISCTGIFLDIGANFQTVKDYATGEIDLDRAMKQLRQSE